MRTKLITAAVSLFAFAASAQAASVKLGVDDSLVTVNSKTAEARYRLNQTNWDQMLSNGVDPITSAGITTAGLGNATALNGKQWDFTISYEDGIGGTQGFTFTMTDTAYGGTTTSTLVYDVLNPLDGLTPTSAFNAIKIEARAGVLRSPGTAAIDITGLTFSSSLASTGALDDPLSAFTPPTTAEQNLTWITADTNLGALDWSISGTVEGNFTCDGGGTGCLRDESIKMNFKFADVNVIPIPAAAWLFFSGLGVLGFMRRK